VPIVLDQVLLFSKYITMAAYGNVIAIISEYIGPIDYGEVDQLVLVEVRLWLCKDVSLL
jgi:hypothetical protein